MKNEENSHEEGIGVGSTKHPQHKGKLQLKFLPNSTMLFWSKTFLYGRNTNTEGKQKKEIISMDKNEWYV